jgi:hypothetical protein
MISAPRESYEKFHYGLRPSKQVERKLLVEALHNLVRAGYAISDYVYLGFGSVYYIDFVLFHKYLYIDKMICVEKTDRPKRMRFNKPFKFIRVRMSYVSQVVNELDPNVQYLVWLDYDYTLNGSALQDVMGFLQRLSRGSVFLLTVDADVKLPNRADNQKYSERERLRRLLAYFREQFEPYYECKVQASDLTDLDLPRLFVRILKSHIQSVMSDRPGLTFHQLFNCVYADGATMLTYGGVIDAPDAANRLNAINIYNSFVTKSDDPVQVSVEL